jgi:hypothetical protein
MSWENIGKEFPLCSTRFPVWLSSHPMLNIKYNKFLTMANLYELISAMTNPKRYAEHIK